MVFIRKKWTDIKGKKLPILNGEELPNVRFIKLDKRQYGKAVMGYNYYDRKYDVPWLVSQNLKRMSIFWMGKR